MSVLKASQPNRVRPDSPVQVIPYWLLPRSADAKQAWPTPPPEPPAHHGGEASINRLMADRAAQVVVAADSSKVGRRAFARICAIAADG